MSQPRPDGPAQRELAALNEGLLLLRQELAEVRRDREFDREQVYKRMVWYSHLEHLATLAKEWALARTAEARMEREHELREFAGRLPALHKFVSPAVSTPEQEQARAEQADVLPWEKPA